MSFYSQTIVTNSKFRSINRVNDLMLLEPIIRAAVLAILNDASAADNTLEVFETYRSQERQQQLFKQGATQLKNVGVHHYGLACDLVRMIDGQPSWKPDYTFLGPLAKKHGLIWGGNWTGFKDMDHVQRIAVNDQNQLFAGTFYPTDIYDPYSITV